MTAGHASGPSMRKTRVIVASFLVLLPALAVSVPLSPGEETPGRSRVVLLGTGTPNAEPDRSGPAAAVVVGDKAYLVDCGPGIVRRAAAAALKGVTALEVKRLDTLFLTHLHSDHSAGLPDVILTPWVLGRERPLELYGPPGTRAMAGHILRAFGEDIRVRTGGREPANPRGYRVRVHEVEPGVAFQEGGVTVRAFPVHHGDWRRAFGYRFECPDRVIVLAGDRSPGTDISSYCRGCDILVHEVYSAAGFKTRPPEWRDYHRDAHTSALELGRLAAAVKPKLLVLTHQLLWGSTEEDLLAEVRSVYSGPVVYGRDLDIY